MSGGGAEGEAPSGASSLPAFSLPVPLSLKRSNETLENHATTQRITEHDSSHQRHRHDSRPFILSSVFLFSKKKRRERRLEIRSTCTFPYTLFHPSNFPKLSSKSSPTPNEWINSPPLCNVWRFISKDDSRRSNLQTQIEHSSPRRRSLGIQKTTRSLLRIAPSREEDAPSVDQPQPVTSIIRFITE